MFTEENICAIMIQTGQSSCDRCRGLNPAIVQDVSQGEKHCCVRSFSY